MIVGSATLTIVASMMIRETPAESVTRAPQGGRSETGAASLTGATLPGAFGERGRQVPAVTPAPIGQETPVPPRPQ